MDIKSEIEKAMKSHLIRSNKEAIEAIEFVRDLLGIKINDLKENESFATNSINDMEIAVRQVLCLDEYVEDNTEE